MKEIRKEIQLCYNNQQHIYDPLRTSIYDIYCESENVASSKYSTMGIKMRHTYDFSIVKTDKMLDITS